MDIDLLSKMVKELILDDDKVVLPGLGCFVAEIVPAYFSDKGYTINPPYRKLYFRSRPDEGDSLIDFYAKSNDVTYDVAEKIVKDFITELRAVLLVKKVVVFPGLGRLRATKENNVFFIADEDLDIYPEGFGLEPISLKTHKESVEEVSAAVSDLKTILDSESVPEQLSGSEQVSELEFVAEPVVELEPENEDGPELLVEPMPEELAEQLDPVEESQPQSQQDALPDPEPVHEKSKSSWTRILLVILVVFVIMVLVYMVIGRLCPEWIDQFLYTPQELEILNY